MADHNKHQKIHNKVKLPFGNNHLNPHENEHKDKNQYKTSTEFILPQPSTPIMYLSSEQKKQFKEWGFIFVPQVVSKLAVQKARLMINQSLGKFPNLERSTTSCPELVANEAILDLFRTSGLNSLVSSLLGHGYYPPPVAFINLQYPGDGCIKDENMKDNPSEFHFLKFDPEWKNYWKIDGLPSPSTGSSDKNHFIRNYSLNAAVFLSDVDLKYSGNMSIWPKSHLMIQNYLNSQGGTKSVLNTGKLDRPNIQNLPLDIQPSQIIAKSGDVILSHYQLAHTHAPNTSPEIHYVVYFRIYSKKHTPGTFKPDSMDDVFLDFEGIYDITKD